MMRIIPTLILAVFFNMLPAATPTHAGEPFFKPKSPLNVTITADKSSYSPGENAELAVMALSLADSDALSIGLELSDGVRVVSGETLWRGAVAKGQFVSFGVVVAIPENGFARVHANAKITDKGGGIFTGSATWSTGRNPVEKSLLKQSPRRIRRNGKSVVDYEVK